MYILLFNLIIILRPFNICAPITVTACGLFCRFINTQIGSSVLLCLGFNSWLCCLVRLFLVQLVHALRAGQRECSVSVLHMWMLFGSPGGADWTSGIAHKEWRRAGNKNQVAKLQFYGYRLTARDEGFGPVHDPGKSASACHQLQPLPHSSRTFTGIQSVLSPTT